MWTAVYVPYVNGIDRVSGEALCGTLFLSDDTVYNEREK